MSRPRVRWSLARRIVLLVLAAELASAATVIGLTFLYQRTAQSRSFDTALRGRAATLLGAVVDASDAADNVVLDLEGLQLPPADLYQVREANGRVLGQTPGWTPPAGWGQSDPRQARNIRVHGVEYRAIHLRGTRIVDPEDEGHGTRHFIDIVYASPSAELWGPVLAQVRASATACVLFLAVSTALLGALLRRSLRPLVDLAAEAKRIAAPAWQFTAPESAGTIKELGPLVQAIEGLVLRLHQSLTQQRQLVNDAAHELKTAVTIVKSSLQLVEFRERALPDGRADQLGDCVADCERLEQLVYRMLLLARVEHQDAAPADIVKAAPIRLRDGIVHSISRLASTAAMRGVRVSVEGSADAAAAVEEGDWRTVVSNLLLNALQHSPPGSEVRVTLSVYNHEVVCRVEDRGEGIPADLLPHVFDRFTRGDSSRARTTGGSGLGLAIAKAIVEQARGTIRITSTVGSGTTVTIQLPRAEVVLQPAEPPGVLAKA